MSNRLADETSPYLRQHADNPVDWWPWGDDAFAEARRRDVPVLVSIGYSACHWCHVMAHESFEDDATAAVMNERFVNVKIDREQRPDVDAVYMEATQAMTGHGGWPMTVFVDHDGRPFHCGTYYPKVRARRHAELRRAAPRRRRRVAEQARRTARAGRPAHRAPAAARAPGVERPATCPSRHVLDEALRGSARRPRRPGRRVRTGAEVPAVDEPRRAAPVRLVHRRRRRSHLARRHGLGRHVGPPRRRLRPVLGRRHLARAPLREDALRPGAARAGLPARLAGHRQPAATARCSTSSWATCCATCATPTAASTRPRTPTARARRACSTRGRPTSCSTCSDPTTAPAPPSSGACSRAATSRAGPSSTGCTPAVASIGRLRSKRPGSGSSTARATRVRPGLDDKVLTEWNALMIATLAEAGPACGRPDWTAAAVEAGDFLLRRAAARRRALAAVVAGRSAGALGARLRRRPRRPGRRLHPPLRGHRRGPLDRRSHRDRRRAARPVLGRRGGRRVHHRPRRRAADRPPEGPARQRHPVGQLARRRRPPPPRRAHRRRPATWSEPRTSCGCSARSPASTRPRWPTCWPPSTSSPTASTRSSSPATAPTCSRSSGPAWRPRAVLAWGERFESPLWRRPSRRREGLRLPRLRVRRARATNAADLARALLG